MIDAGKIVAALELDTGKFEKGLSTSQALMKTWANGNVSLSEKLSQTGEVVSGLGKTLSTTLTLPIAAAGTAAVTTFTNFDDAMRQVRATMNASAEDTEKLTAAAKKMGAETRYSASESANALNYLALAGYDADQAIEALPTVLRLAQAGGLDLAYASDLVTDSMSALGLSMSDLTTFTDQMAVTSQKSNTNVSQLGEAILTVGGTAKSLAGGTAELNAELGILADIGIKGAEGGTHLRNVILALQSPTEQGAALLAEYTNGVYDADGNMRSLDVIFGELKDSMSGMTQASRDAIVSGIFNMTDLAAVQGLLAGAGERFAELTGYILNADGAAEEMANIMEGGIGGAFRSLKSAVEGMAIEFGERLAPTVEKVAEFITNMVRRFTELPVGMQETIVKIAAFAAAMGPVLMVGGKVIAMFGTMAKVLSGPGGWIALGIAGVAALTAALVKLNQTKVTPGISTEELENYRLPEAVDLGKQSVEFEAEVRQKGKTVFDQIVEILNDGKPETPEEIDAMNAGVYAVIEDSVKAIEENYNTKKASLDQLFKDGLIDEEEYETRVTELEEETQKTKDALESDAQAVTDFVQACVEANAPMTEEQIKYLQSLIDKLTDTATAAGAAEDAVMSSYRMAFEREAGGYGVEGDVEKGATYIEAEYQRKLNELNAARDASQADYAAEMAQYAEGSDKYNEVLEKSKADLEAWEQAATDLKAEREAMYAEMAEGTGFALTEEDEANIERLTKLLELQERQNELFAKRSEIEKNGTDEDWDAYDAEDLALNAEMAAMGVDNLYLEINKTSEALNGLDVDKIRDIMGYLYGNDAEADATKIDTVQGLAAAYLELLNNVEAAEEKEEAEKTAAAEAAEQRKARADQEKKAFEDATVAADDYDESIRAAAEAAEQRKAKADQEKKAFEDATVAANDYDEAIRAAADAANAEAFGADEWQGPLMGVSDALSGVADAAETAAGDTATSMSEMLGAMNAEYEASVAGQNTVAGYVGAIYAGGPAVFNAGYYLGNMATAGVNAGQDSHSPSRKMAKSGKWAVEGYVQGIRENMTLVDAAAREIAGTAMNGTEKAASGAGGSGNGSGTVSAGRNVTLNINGAVVRNEEDIRHLARRLGGYINAVNFT